MIHEFQLRMLPEQTASEELIADYVAEEKGIARKGINHVSIIRRSIDARQRTSCSPL